MNAREIITYCNVHDAHNSHEYKARIWINFETYLYTNLYDYNMNYI